CLLVRIGSESILLGTSNATILGHLFREDTHGNLAVLALRVGFKELRELSDSVGAILQAHALDASTDTDLDLTNPDGVGNVDNRLKTAGALPVCRTNCCGNWETSNEGSSTELGGTTTLGKD